MKQKLDESETVLEFGVHLGGVQRLSPVYPPACSHGFLIQHV